MKLSIVVPIYNVEKYLCKCIDSLLNQDLPKEQYEIILVDDGSPDKCGAIADESAKQHTNIKVIHQENGGLSVARNTGIEAAQGDYIQFVDSDDYLEQNVLKSLVDKMDKDYLDVLRFDYQNVNESYEVYQPYKDVKPFVDLRDEICDGVTFLNERLGYACYACQFVIRTELIKRNKLHFKPGIYFEDTEWTPRLLSSSTRVTSYPIIAYNYLVRSDSISQNASEDRIRKVLDDKISLIHSLKSQAEKINDRRWYDGMIASTAHSTISLVSLAYFDNRKEYLHSLSSLKIYPLSKYHTTKRCRRKIMFINLSPILFCTILHIKTLFQN